MGYIDDLRMISRNGRMIRENGSEINVADYYAFLQDYDIKYETVFNGASVLSCRFNVAATSTVYVVIEVAANRQLVIFDKIIDLTEGKYTADVYKVVSYGSAQQSVYAKSPLNTASQTAVQSNMIVDPASVVLGDVLQYDIALASKNTDTLKKQDVFKMHKDSVAYEFTKLDTGTGTVNLTLLCWEQPA